MNLHSNDVSTDSFQVSWDHSANDIVLYRLSWAPFTGGYAKEVSTNNKIWYVKEPARSEMRNDVKIILIDHVDTIGMKH